MIKYRYIFGLLSVAVGIAYASNMADGDKGKQERIDLPIAKLSARQQSVYPALRREGNPDGTPYGLRLSGVSDKQVSISWLSSEKTDGYFDDFESHDNFAINSAGSIGWKYIDGDIAYIYTWSACSFPGQGEKMAYIIMNPWQTSPAVNENPNFQPVSGEKMLVDFSAKDVQNNDYIISPELSFDRDFKISFQARSYTSMYNLERIRIGYSTTEARPSDFKFVTEPSYIEVPAEWTLIEYTIPKEARYVTINCVSDDAFMLMIDDIFIGTNNVRPGIKDASKAAAEKSLVGFNVYRDGTKVNGSLVSEIRYTDTVDEYGKYTYTVRAVYSDGSESADSEPLDVEVPDIRSLTFEDVFFDWTLHSDKWTTVSDDGASQNFWGIDYEPYGLVDPCVAYQYSSLTDYNQSLVTRELNTSDVAATYLRFNLKLSAKEIYTLDDSLAVEVTDDDGKTWKQMALFNNLNEGFDWKVCQMNVGKYISNNIFKIRFRAFGADARTVDYWYVDDVKIWTPEWTQAVLSVTSADGPVRNCPVTLTADHGAVINDTTDASGQIDIAHIEPGKYDVEIAEDGYNVYDGEWNVAPGSTNSHTITLTRPVLSLSQTEISADLASESKTTKKINMRNVGDGPMTWHLNSAPAPQSGDITNRWNIEGTFNASGDLQTSVAFDGEYYYTTSSTNLGDFWKYDRNGKLVEQFRIPGIYYILYDLAYDGRYFYASDFSNRLFQLDFENRRIVRTITVSGEPSLKISHCTYDPDKDQFWIGDFSNIARIDRDGNITSRLIPIDGSSTLSVYGSGYDNVTPGGPYLWFTDMTAGNEMMLDKMRILQYDLNTRKLTGVSHVPTDIPGYKIGTSSTGVNYVCGMTTTTDVKNGTLTLIGILKQSPSLIFSYTLCETNDWLGLSPKHGTLNPGEEQEITVDFNALNARKGDVLTSTASIQTIPEMADKDIRFTLNATSEAACPRPLSLEAVAGKGSAKLGWKQGSKSKTPIGYNIYRNGMKVNKQLVTDTVYSDTKLVYGQYVYKVAAVYDGTSESAMSDSATVLVKDGAPYYAPLSLQASIADNKNVSLSWRSPRADAGNNESFTWSDGKNADQMGLSDGGYFYAASAWDAEDLMKYRYKKVTSVSVQIVNPCTYLQLRVYKDGEIVSRKTYRGDYVYDGSYTEVTLDEPVTIDPGATYSFAFMIMNDADVRPLGMDGNKAVDGKGNMLSLDGTTWFPASYQGISGNFNIKVNVVPADNTEEEEPVGYNVYRDGKQVNGQTVSGFSYSDAVEEPGKHSYTVSSLYADGGESAKSASSDVSVVDIQGRYAPADVNADVKINRDVTLRWSFPTENAPTFPVDVTTRPVTVKAGYPEYVNSFTGMGTETAVASDGKYVYSSIYNEDGRINKYSLDGKYLGFIKVDGVSGIRNLTYDGEYLYAADNQNCIQKIDPENMTLVSSIPVSEYARHLTFMPDADGGKGGFEVGDWETSIVVAKDGSKLSEGPSLLGAAGTAYYDGKLYAFEQGGDDNSYSIGVYDMASHERVATINLGDYVELGDITSGVAGGMSVVYTPEGMTYLAMCLQRQNEKSLFVFVELGNVAGVKGYNVYRNGTKLNTELLTHRYYEESLTEKGDYDYTVETVYIDGTSSSQSVPAKVSIVDAGEAKAPVNVKAQPSSYGYNVLLSFSEPDLNAAADVSESFEAAAVSKPVNVSGWQNEGSAWLVDSEYAYDGDKLMTAGKGDEALLVIPVEGMGCLRMAVRNADDHGGNGSVDVLYSLGGAEKENFIQLNTYSTNEQWQDVTCRLPEGVEYVAIRKRANIGRQYVDAIAVYKDTPSRNVYSFDIFRNGRQINEKPITDIGYIDRNLVNGHYDYQVRLTTTSSAVSDLSEKVSVDVSNDNGGMAPTNLVAATKDDGKVALSWKYPALCEPDFLRWHDGSSYDAAGLPNGGAFFAGVRWYSSDLKAYDQMTLTNVEFYVNQIPDALFILVYEGNTLVRQQYVPELKQYSFNDVRLDEPLYLDTSKDLRVAVYVEHTEISVPLGYDKGPAKSGRGNLYSTDGVTWTTLADSDTGIDGNWNISIGLSPYPSAGADDVRRASALRQFTPRKSSGAQKLKSVASGGEKASSANVFEGFNVYCNNNKLNTEFVNDSSYEDPADRGERYLEYKVSAVYSVSGEKFSDKVVVAATGIEGVGAEGMSVCVSDDAIKITGARAGSRVRVYSAGGQVVYSSVTGDGYAYIIPAARFATGTYIVYVDNASFKVYVK